MNQVSLILVVKSKPYEIPFQFKGLCEINPDIYYQLLVNPNHKYYVESNISEENFQSFIDYFVYEKEPIISIHNYFDFYQIGQEFQFPKLNDLVKSVKQKWNNYELNLHLLNDPNIKDKFIIEKNISSNLDEYILKYGTQLMNVPIQSLMNIFNDPNKKFTEHNQAYNLIKQHFDDTQDNSIFVLLPKIDGNKLNESNFEDTFLTKSKRYGFMTQIDLNYFNLSKEINKLNEKNIRQEEINQKLINDLNAVHKKFNLLYDEFNSYKTQNIEKFQLQEKKYEELLQNNHKLNDDINKLNEEFDSYKTQNNTVIQNQNKFIEEQKLINQEQMKKNNKFDNELNEKNCKKISTEFNSFKIQNDDMIKKLENTFNLQLNEYLKKKVFASFLYEFAMKILGGFFDEINKEAIKYMKIAINLGNSDAMNKYGLMLDNGDDIPMNKEEAIKYYKMAIDLGNSNAMYNYGYMLEHGDGIPMNKEEAIKYYKMAIDQDNSRSMYHYACMLLNGDGVSVDKDEAVKYFKMSSEKGDENAKQKLKEMNII